MLLMISDISSKQKDCFHPRAIAITDAFLFGKRSVFVRCFTYKGVFVVQGGRKREEITMSDYGPAHILQWMSLQANADHAFPPSFAILWGGRYLPKIQGEEWRWLTSLFIHETIVHLATNSLLFFILSAILEKRLGFW